MSVEIAKILIDIKSVNFSFKNHFTLTSGLKSPVYVDCRRIISFIKEREIIIETTLDARLGAEILDAEIFKELGAEILGELDTEIRGVDYLSIPIEIHCLGQVKYIWMKTDN